MKKLTIVLFLILALTVSAEAGKKIPEAAQLAEEVKALESQLEILLKEFDKLSPNIEARSDVERSVAGKLSEAQADLSEARKWAIALSKGKDFQDTSYDPLHGSKMRSEELRDAGVDPHKATDEDIANMFRRKKE